MHSHIILRQYLRFTNDGAMIRFAEHISLHTGLNAEGIFIKIN